MEIEERRGQIEGEDLVLQARIQIKMLATEVNVAAINSTKTSLPTKMALAENTRDSESTPKGEFKDTRNKAKWQSAQRQGEQ